MKKLSTENRTESIPQLWSITEGTAKPGTKFKVFQTTSGGRQKRFK